MDWTRLDWKTLDRLRDGFLSGAAANGPYWKSLDDLAHYDLTFAERIGWKWDAVVDEMTRRQWQPPAGPLLDFGCGSGVAGRRLLRAFPGAFSSYLVADHSPFARQFSREKAAQEFPGLLCADAKADEEVGTLVISHVLNEMSEAAQRDLLAVARRAQAVVWIEAGTHDASRRLAAVRDTLRDTFEVFAPCTHREACPLFKEANAQHWCHFFAPSPKGIYADSNWVKFGQRAGVDLRSLPYSFLVLGRQPAPDVTPADHRVIGRLHVHKAHTDLFLCSADNVRDVKMTKRANPALTKKWDKKPGLPLLRATLSGDQLESVEELFP